MQKRSLHIALVLLTFCLCAGFRVDAQGVSIGKNGKSAHPKSIMELVSEGKGLLIPRMNTEQRLAMFQTEDKGAMGLLVFDTSVAAFYFWMGTQWQQISGSEQAISVLLNADYSLEIELNPGDKTSVDLSSLLTLTGTELPDNVYSGTSFFNTSTGEYFVFDGEEWRMINKTSDGGDDGTIGEDKDEQTASEVPVAKISGLAASNVQQALEQLYSKFETTNIPSVRIAHDATLSGNGSASKPLGLADYAVTTAKLGAEAVTTEKIAPAALANQFLITNSSGEVVWAEKEITEIPLRVVYYGITDGWATITATDLEQLDSKKISPGNYEIDYTLVSEAYYLCVVPAGWPIPHLDVDNQETLEVLRMAKTLEVDGALYKVWQTDIKFPSGINLKIY